MEDREEELTMEVGDKVLSFFANNYPLVLEYDLDVWTSMTNQIVEALMELEKEGAY